MVSAHNVTCLGGLSPILGPAVLHTACPPSYIGTTLLHLVILTLRQSSTLKIRDLSNSAA